MKNRANVEGIEVFLTGRAGAWGGERRLRDPLAATQKAFYPRTEPGGLQLDADAFGCPELVGMAKWSGHQDRRFTEELSHLDTVRAFAERL